MYFITNAVGEDNWAAEDEFEAAQDMCDIPVDEDWDDMIV